MEEHSACLLISLFSFQAVELQHKDHCFQIFYFILQNDKKFNKIFELIWQLQRCLRTKSGFQLVLIMIF